MNTMTTAPRLLQSTVMGLTIITFGACTAPAADTSKATGSSSVAYGAPPTVASAATPTGTSTTSPTAQLVTVYKSPTCECCKKWVDHLRSSGFRVATVDQEDVTPVKQQYGVGEQVASCHTAVVGGYVVEGHVPAEDIKRLLLERPAVAGIAAPGMPVGAPGMEMPGNPGERYDVVSFDRLGNTRIFASH